MPLIFNENLDNEILIWEIIEELDYLKQEIFEYLNPDEKKYFEEIKNLKRKKEWLIVRILLKNKLKNYETIFYDLNNKPYLKSGLQIGISHSQDFVGIILSKNQNVSIDIEKVSDKSQKIKNKFLSKTEIENIINEDLNLTYTLLWSAKETLYKMYGKKELIFNQNIEIKKFNLKSNKIIEGKISTHQFMQNYQINYYIIENNIVTWCKHSNN